MSDVCSECKRSLHQSITKVVKGLQYKSCPKCSQNAGKHVFYEYGAFGMRHMQKTGKDIVQSWCPGCRPQSSAVALPISFVCGQE